MPYSLKFCRGTRDLGGHLVVFSQELHLRHFRILLRLSERGDVLPLPPFSGLGQGFIFPALSTYVIDFLGRENKGLALGLYLSLFDIGMGLGSPFFGWISDVSGYRQMYAVAGCLIICLTVVFSVKAPVIPAAAQAESGRERIPVS